MIKASFRNIELICVILIRAVSISSGYSLHYRVGQVIPDSVIKMTNEFLLINFFVLYIEKSIPLNLTIEQLYEILPFDDQDGGVWKQGFNIEIDENRFDESKPLKVFVVRLSDLIKQVDDGEIKNDFRSSLKVPHSHNDPGWLKTFDQYYKDQTKSILDNMLEMLPEYQKMTFIWAEISYFAKWYDELKSEDSREMVKTLLDNGQLEIASNKTLFLK